MALQSINKFAFFIVLFISFTSCKKKDTLQQSTNELLSIKLESSLNPNILTNDITGEIKGTDISFTFLNSLDISELVVTLIHDGNQVLLNGETELSPQTKIDFTQKTWFVIVAKNGDKQVYMVIVKQVDDPELVLKDFSFKTEFNIGLKNDHIFTWKEDTLLAKVRYHNKQLIASFDTEAFEVTVNGVPQKSGITVNDFSTPVVYTLTTKNGFKKEYVVKTDWGQGVPHFYIETEGGLDITSKDNYLKSTITVDGDGVYEDFVTTAGIRGRGNSTWVQPKKPYRIKLDKKASIFGLKEERDWVLLANYLDETLMLNAVGMKVGQLIGLPYTNHIIPVELTINGKFMGNYMLTEQVEVSKSRVDIEDGGQLLELDIYYDEDWQFRSDNLNLPVMVKYPDLEDYSLSEANTELNKIKNEFQQLENAIAASSFPNNDYKSYIDIESVIDYFIVYMLTGNEEINHPKSTYIYKPKGGKYKMGPIWDFDWAFSYDGANTHFNSYSNPLFLNGQDLGTKFFSRFMMDPEVRSLFKVEWTAFKANKLPELLIYIDEYAEQITDSQKRDFIRWDRGSSNFQQDVLKLRNWVIARANYIDGLVGGL